MNGKESHEVELDEVRKDTNSKENKQETIEFTEDKFFGNTRLQKVLYLVTNG
jgi:hypothetical protein